MSSRRAQIIRLRASIVGIEPEIWRTIDVDDSMSLVDLHRVLQVAFGWHDAHLHSFSDHDPSASANGIPRIGRRPRLWVDADSLGEFEGADGEDAADGTYLDDLEVGSGLHLSSAEHPDADDQVALTVQLDTTGAEPPTRTVASVPDHARISP
ncbi:MAG: hypothetical protein J0I62_13210, partial [Microbacterium sp.]|nr:hypothetical protein [Microbacterium sp.]